MDAHPVTVISAVHNIIRHVSPLAFVDEDDDDDDAVSKEEKEEEGRLIILSLGLALSPFLLPLPKSLN